MDDSAPDGAALRRRSAAHLLADAADLAGDHLIVEDDDQHHLRRVLRLGDGDVVTATDGAGRWRPFRVVAPGGPSDLWLEAIEPLRQDAPPPAPVTIASAIPKGDRVDWLVQKATECGVDRLILLDCERSVVRWKPERAERQLARLRRIADEAVRQSRRVWRPEIVGPTTAGEVLASATAAEPGGDRLTVADSIVAIGPEGGWSSTELAMIDRRVELAPHVLRTETAAVVATALCVALRH